MHPSTRTRRLTAGFTLVEVFIAAAAMLLVLVYTLNTFTVNRNTYVVIESVSEAHQNSIAISSLIERDLRNAGYMVPNGAAACGVDATNGPDALFVSDGDAILDADDPALTASFAAGNLAATPSTALVDAGVDEVLTVDNVTIDGVDTYDTDATPGPDSDFRVGGGAILINLQDPTEGVYCGRVIDVAAVANQVTINLISSTAGVPLAVNNGWGLVPAHIYEITADTLTRDGSVLARNVEDLQLAWFYDLNENGQVDANEDFGSGGAEPDLTPHSLPDPALLREVRLNLVVRTAAGDPNDLQNAGIGQARENRVNPPPADDRRRRVHTATIRLRNVNV